MSFATRPRSAKRAIIALGVAVGATLAALLLVPRLISLDDFREPIAAKLEEISGRKVTLGGIKLSLIPSPQIKLNRIAIGEDGRLGGEQPFASVAEISLGARLWPLLRGRLEISSICVKEPRLQLVRGQDGLWNFSSIVRARDKEGWQFRSPAPEGPHSAPIQIDSASISDGNVTIVDRSGPEPITSKLHDLDLNLYGLADRRLKFKLTTEVGDRGSRIDMAGTIDLTALTNPQQADVGASLKLRRAELEDLFNLASALRYGSIEGLSARGALDADLEIKGGLARPNFSGKIRLADVRLHHRHMAAPLHLKGASINISNDTMRVDAIKATFGGSNLQGELTAQNLRAPRVRFALHIDSLDLKELIAAKVNVEGGRAQAQNAGSHRGEPSKSWLSNLAVDPSTVTVDRVTFGALLLTNLSTNVELKDRVIKLSSLVFDLSGGKHHGFASLDLRGEKARCDFKARLVDADVNQLLSRNTSLKDLIHGLLFVDGRFSCSGSSREELERSLSGSGLLRITKGRVANLDLRERLVTVGRLVGLEYSGRGTEFDDLEARFRISDGRVHLQGLKLRLPGMSLIGSGNLGFDKSVNFELAVELAPEVSKMIEERRPLASLAAATFFKNESGHIIVPLRIKGTIENPTFSLNTDLLRERLRSRGLRRGLKGLEELFKEKDKTPR